MQTLIDFVRFYLTSRRALTYFPIGDFDDIEGFEIIEPSIFYYLPDPTEDDYRCSITLRLQVQCRPDLPENFDEIES